MVVWSPFRFNSGHEAANRFAMAPLTTDASHQDGTVTDHELEFVRRRAASGFALIVSSAARQPSRRQMGRHAGEAHEFSARGRTDRARRARPKTDHRLSRHAAGVRAGRLYARRREAAL